jgi:acetolactate synthase-1/2/3 large subunit
MDHGPRNLRGPELADRGLRKAPEMTDTQKAPGADGGDALVDRLQRRRRRLHLLLVGLRVGPGVGVPRPPPPRRAALPAVPGPDPRDRRRRHGHRLRTRQAPPAGRAAARGPRPAAGLDGRARGAARRACRWWSASSESTTYGDGPGQDPGGQWYRNLSIVGGPHGIAQPFTKWSNEAASVHTLPTMVTRAAELAWRAPAGPAYLNIPLEILLEEWDGREAKPSCRRAPRTARPKRSTPSPS